MASEQPISCSNRYRSRPDDRFTGSLSAVLASAAGRMGFLRPERTNKRIGAWAPGFVAAGWAGSS